MRTEAETIIDRLLLLYAVEQGNKHGRMDGTFKLQKIPFVSELEMNANGVKGFNYTFFRYTHGPMSKQIYADGGALHSAGLITSLKKGAIKLTDDGKKLFESLTDLYNENRETLQFIDSAAIKYAPLSFAQLKKRIYALSVPLWGENWKVAEVPEFTDMLEKLDPSRARTQFTIDDDWIDSLWGTLHYSEEQKRKLHIVHEVDEVA